MKYFLLSILLLSTVSAQLSISPTILEAETQINNEVDYQITITNNYNFDIFDLSFGDLESKGFTFPDIEIAKNSSKTVTILFKPTTSIHENIPIPVNFKYFVDLPLETTTHEINITDPNGFLPNYLPIKQGDSVKFNNKHTVSFDVVVEGSSYHIPINSSITHQFNTLGTITYQDTYFNFYGTVEILNKSVKEKARNPNYKIDWAVNINSILNPTTLEIDNSKIDYEVEYGKFKKGLLTIKNTGTEKAELVSLTSTDWISFNKNNIINIEPDEEEWVEYTITPIVFDTNDTDQTCPIEIKIKASNSPEYIKEIDVFVPYKTISTSFGDDDFDDRAWLDNIFCPRYPNSLLCNASASSGANGSIVYKDSDIPINVSKRVIYDIQKDLKGTMDSNERTNNVVKIVADMLNNELPSFKNKLNESLYMQEENEKKNKSTRNSIAIVFFFIFIYGRAWKVFSRYNTISNKKDLMEGGFNIIEKQYGKI